MLQLQSNRPINSTRASSGRTGNRQAKYWGPETFRKRVRELTSARYWPAPVSSSHGGPLGRRPRRDPSPGEGSSPGSQCARAAAGPPDNLGWAITAIRSARAMAETSPAARKPGPETPWLQFAMPPVASVRGASRGKGDRSPEPGFGFGRRNSSRSRAVRRRARCADGECLDEVCMADAPRLIRYLEV